MSSHIIRIYFVCFVSTLSVWCTSRENPLVETKLGWIRGLRASDGDYSMFMGIPYARVNRSNPFGVSTPQEPFDDIFEAYDDSAICPQIEEFNNTVTGSLDCLHLNIYVPNSASSKNLLPVLVWIYGGGFQYGFAGSYVYGPKYLVRHEIILVTLNYRVGPYGFMCLDTPEISGNQGFKDQLLALKWVKDNIKAFGGDSDKITASGESAGGIAVDFHLLSPHENLFNSAIIQSGTTYSPSFYKPVKDAPLLLTNYLGYKTDNMNDALSFLASIDTDSVISAVAALKLQFRPCVEKEFDGVDRFITENWLYSKAPKVKNMPILIGTNSDEWLMVYASDDADFPSDLFYNQLAVGFNVDDDRFIDMEKIVRQFYIGDEPIDARSKWEIIDFVSDLKFHYPTYRSVSRYIENNAENIYKYVFSYAGENNFVKRRVNITIGGAAHADEIGYLFDVSFFDNDPTSEDQLVIDRMTTMWANFVKFGNPTPKPTELLPIEWLPITEGSSHYYLEINSELTTNSRPFSRRMAFWELFYKLNKDLQWIYPADDVN